MGIRSDCVSWDPQTHTCRALTQLVCKNTDCKFFLRPEQKRAKDEMTRERLERVAGVDGSRVHVTAAGAEELCRTGIKRMGRPPKERDEEKSRKKGAGSGYFKERYKTLKARGICVKCGREKARPGRTSCENCAVAEKKRKIKN